jgi:hypothetical protein
LQNSTNRHHKNAQKKHTHPHSWMLLGNVLRKGWWYLAALNHTTSGFHTAFQFWLLLGSTS